MNGYFLGLLMAFAAGVFASAQGAINALIGKTTGQYLMVVTVSLMQAVVGAFFLLRTGGTMSANIVPWILVAGALGMAIMFGISASISTIGTLTVFILLILGQIICSTVIDHFGLFGSPRLPITPQKIGSLAIILLGVYCLIKSS